MLMELLPCQVLLQSLHTLPHSVLTAKRLAPPHFTDNMLPQSLSGGARIRTHAGSLLGL